MEITKQRELKEFISIEYPGRVVNNDKMVESLGGIEELSKGFQEKQKLQLKFRQNFYAKPALSSEPLDATGMLLKVRVRRAKNRPEKKPEILSTELVGTVSTIYKFNNFADFQYLPIQRNEKTGKTENIYNDIVPQDITVGPTWFRENLNVPIFLPPAAFTRTDTMQNVAIKNDVNSKDDEADDTMKFAVTNRMSRATNGISITFNMSDPVPTKPNESVKDLVKSNLVSQEDYDAVLLLFQERPIWTLAALRAYLRTPPRRLNYCLAGIAYYYSTGPWRNCFVLFGYDTRKNFNSRFYQMLDYRVRQGVGFKEQLKVNRYSGINKRVKVAVRPDGGAQCEEEIEENLQMRRKQAIFTPDTIPPFRARHYQFVDIHIPKIQEMLHKIPSPISGAICNEKRGWLPAGFMEQCRDILTLIAQENMQKLCNEKNISLEQFKAENIKLELPAGEEDGGEESDADDEADDAPDEADEPDEKIDE